MWKSHNFEIKQESHYFQEKRSNLGYKKEYYVPPPTIQKIESYQPFHYESSDVEEDDDDHHHYHYHHHHHDPAVNNNRRLIHHDGDHGNRGNWGGTHHANNHADVMNKHQQGGKLLRPPLHQYRHPIGNGHQRNEAYSRTNTNEDRNHTMGGHPRTHFPNYGEVSRVGDEYDDNKNGVRGELEYPLMKGIMHGGNRVKRVEVIEYERRIHRGARQEWIVLGGNGATTYPNGHAPWMTGFN